jgi:hypothetical protein
MPVINYPYYFYLIKFNRNENFTVFHHWTIPISLVMVLGTLADNYDFMMYLAYFGLFTIFYLIGNFAYFHNKNLLSNGYKCLGALGMLFMLFLLSYDWLWSDLILKEIILNQLITSREFILSLSLIIIMVIFSFKNLKIFNFNYSDPLALLFIPFILIFISGFFNSVWPQVMINLLIVIWAIIMIKKGSKVNNRRYLNIGLFILSALIISRFFDWNLSFVLRGLAFIIVGTAFFLSNYLLIKNRKTAGFNS